MLETLWKMTLLDEYTFAVVVCMVVAAFSIIRGMTGSTVFALLYTPIMAFGALASNYLFRMNFFVVVHDKDSNVIAASATGVLAALILMLVATRIAIYVDSHKPRNHRPLLPESGRELP